MEAGFVAYIDEAGDPGIKLKSSSSGGASEWFVISAVVVSVEKDPDVPIWVADMREAVRSQQRSPLHYRKLSPSNQQRVCRMLSSKHVRIFTVASHKTNMRGRKNPRMTGRMDRGEFYNWCLRLLFERVTEWCYKRAMRDFDEPRPVRTVFSQRGGHDYEHLRDYLRKMDLQALNGGLVLTARKIIPGMLPPALCEVWPHDRRAGLQLADIAASAMFQAVEAQSPTHSLDGARSLRDRTARDKRGGVPATCGLMLMPLPHQGSIPIESRPIFEDYGYRFPDGVAGPGLCATAQC